MNFSRPAIDVLFESAADAYGARLAGGLLSGANQDGSRGLARIHANGGVSIVQAPETAAALYEKPADAGSAAQDAAAAPQDKGTVARQGAEKGAEESATDAATPTENQGGKQSDAEKDDQQKRNGDGSKDRAAKASPKPATR